MNTMIRLVRQLVALVILLMAIVLPVGVFAPFTAGDYLAMGESPPTVGETLMWFLPVEMALLFAVYLIDPKKAKGTK